jgi:hypothetical protein
MNHYYKGKAKKITLACLSVSLLIIITLYSRAYDAGSVFFHMDLTPADTVPEIKKDSLHNNFNPSPGDINLDETKPGVFRTKKSNDTITRPVADTFSFRTSKDTLSAPVTYHADDSMIFDVPGKKLILYGKESTVKYTDNELTAPHIEYDQSTNLVKAILKKDSSGKVIAYPAYTQADFKSISDSIEFNMKSGKGLTKGTYTQQGEMFVYGEKIKKVDESVFYAKNGRFTTCNLDTPHFAFVSRQIKFINKKMAFTGPVHPEIEGVPLPIVLPFGIYPLKQGRHSGLMAPSFTANDQYGFALEGLGYYKVLSENWDVITQGTLYSYGGWRFNVNPRYFRKYRYQGNLNYGMIHNKVGFKGDPDYFSSRAFNIQWSHSADTKARPGVTFTAHVDAGSTKYNSLIPNNAVQNFNNQLNSTIHYSKSWKDKPYNYSLSATHNQNSVSGLVNVNLPDVNFNLNTLYPFRRAEVTGEYKWYENISVGLNTVARNLTSFYDTAANIGQQIKDNLKWGASHSVPITLSLPSLGPVQVSPGVSYAEQWFQEKFYRKYNPVSNKIDTSISQGFYTARDIGFSLGMSTRIFGAFSFGKKSSVQAIRHELRPSLGLSYKPNLNANNFYTLVDSAGRSTTESYYQRNIFRGFSNVRFAGLNFTIDNILQMKVRNRKDTGDASLKKVSLLDGLSLSGNYNFLLDSFKLSGMNFSARSNLFNKINITAFGSLDPYQIDADGRRIDKLVWSKNPLSLGKLSTANISLQSQFKGGDKSGNSTDNNAITSARNATQQDPNAMPLDEYEQEAAYIRQHPGEFVDFNIPWSIDFSYSLLYSRVRNFSVVTKTITQSVNWNSSVNLTPKWKIGASGSYNITEKNLGYLSMYLSRDLHCWQMAISLVPVGRFKFFTINISPKSPLLRDLKVNRTRSFQEL